MTSPLAAYFRFKLEGWENVPTAPCLFIGNHSIGSPFVLPLLARAWHQDGGDRTVRGMMHRLAYKTPFRQWGALQRLGGIYAHPQVARDAIKRGHSLLIFPGGDVDAMRPFGRRYQPDFDGRCGFIRLAREEKLKLVPLAICGSHAAYFSLPGAQSLARLLRLQQWAGLKRFPLTLGTLGLGATLALPPLWPLLPFLGLAAALPLPTRISARFLPPVEVEIGESDQDAAERVRAAIERSLEQAAASRLTPWG